MSTQDPIKEFLFQLLDKQRPIALNLVYWAWGYGEIDPKAAEYVMRKAERQ